MPTRCNERGTALVAALMALATLSLLAAGVVTLGMGATRSASYRANHAAALYVAESGINETIFRLDHRQEVHHRRYPGEQPSFVSAAGTLDGLSYYKVWVEEAGSGRVTVTVRGTRGGVDRVVRVTLRLPSFGSCLFADPDGDGIIELSQRPPRACPDIDVIVRIPEAPPGTPPGPDSRIKRKEGASHLPPGSYLYRDGLVLENGAELTVAGPATLYVTGDLRVKREARLRIHGEVTFFISESLSVGKGAMVATAQDARANLLVGEAVSFGKRSRLESEGPTTFYVGESFDLQESAQAGTDPAALILFMSTETEPKVALKDEAVFHGGIYAPTGEVKLRSLADLTGAVVGETVDIGKGATVTYDPMLAAGTEGGTGVVGGSWGEM